MSEVNPHNVKCRNGVDPVVMVDDHPSDRLIAQHIYERSLLKNPLLLLPDGHAFLEFMEKAEKGMEPVPALVLMDINMPGVNGFEATRAIRNRLPFRDDPPIIMLTNSERKQDEERAYEVGANGFQTKTHEVDHYVAFFNSLYAGAAEPSSNGG